MNHSIKKLLFSLALISGLALGTAAVCSFAERYRSDQGIWYEYTPGETTASVMRQPIVLSGNKTITSKITVAGKDYVVTGISEEAFYGCENLTGVIIPPSVNSIGERAFNGCSSLMSITIPSTVTSMGEYMFHDCQNLTNVYVKDGGTLGSDPFEDNQNINVWRYRVNETAANSEDGKTHVTITSLEDKTCHAATVSSNICIMPNAMGDNYVIDAVEVGNVQLGHTLTQTPAKAATCTTEGNTEYWTCSHCDKHYRDAEGTTEIAEGYWVISATGHDFENYIAVPETCTTEGCMGYICRVCGYSYVDENMIIPKSPHELTLMPAKAATCTEEGNTEYWTCSHCGKHFSDAEGTTEIAEGDWVISATGHDWGAATFEWAEDCSTCTATWTCKNNGNHKVTETVTAEVVYTTGTPCTGDWTIVYEANFTNYDEGILGTDVTARTFPMTGHTWSENWSKDDENHWRECTVCHEKEDGTAHAWSDWTQVDDTNHKRTCTVCGAEQTVAHTWGAWTQVDDTNHKRTCTVCGAEQTVAHTWGAWTQVDDTNHKHVCTACGAEQTVAHTWGDWTQVDDTNHKHTCECGAKQTVAHTWGAWTQVDDTNHKHTCGDCNHTATEVHAWGTPVVTKEVTDTEAGEMKYVCKTCGAEKVEEVPALDKNKAKTLEQTVDKNGEPINCIVQDPYKVLPEEVRLEIKLAEGQRYDELNSQLDPTHPIENVAFFDIKLYAKNEDGVEYELHGLDRKVRVLLQIPKGWDKADMEAVLIAEDADIEFEEDIVTIDGVDYVAFWTNHFSPYATIDELTEEEARAAAAVESAESNKEADSTEESGSIETGDEINSYIMLEMVLFLASASLFVALRRRQKILLNEKK